MHFTSKQIKKMIVVYLIAVLLYGCFYVYRLSLYGVKDTAKQNDLPVSQMMVFDENNKPYGNVRFPFFSDIYLSSWNEEASSYHIGDDIKIGDSWEAFVEQFGDYEIYSAYIIRYTVEKESVHYNYESSESLNTPQTVKELDAYLSQNYASIPSYEVNLTFSTYYYHNAFYHNYDDYFDALYAYEQTFLYHINPPRDGRITMNLEFAHNVNMGDNLDNGLTSINIYRYNY